MHELSYTYIYINKHLYNNNIEITKNRERERN